MSDKPTLVYVDGRGNGERVRFVLAGANIDFDESNLTTKSERLELVQSGKLLTDQVPLLNLDGLNLVQSWSIVRYIGNTRGLVPSLEDPASWAKVDIITESVRDYESHAGLCDYGWSDKTEHQEKIQTAMSKWFPRLEKMVSDNGYCVADKHYYCDFVLLNVLSYSEEIFPDCLEKYPKLKAVRERLSELPQIKAFLTSDKRKGLVNEEYIKLVKEVFH